MYAVSLVTADIPEHTCSSESHNPEDYSLNSHHRETLKSHGVFQFVARRFTKLHSLLIKIYEERRLLKERSQIDTKAC
jgi:hypothetical protein